MSEESESTPDYETFAYEPPAEITHPKLITNLCNPRDSETSRLLRGQVQVISDEEGSINLHSHTGSEGFWMVLEGRARFYTEDDEVIDTFEKREGVHIPMNVPYWFESVGDEPLELLHVQATSETTEDRRIDHEEHYLKGKKQEEIVGFF